MTEIELNGLDEIGEYLDQRELYGIATMIKRKQDEASGAEGASTYLAMALSAPVERGHERPCITGASSTLMLPLRLPANSPWASDPVGDEPPLGFSIDELPALGGASAPLHDTEDAKAVQGGREDNSRGEQ
jgi:hypothetical protein